MAQNSKIEWTDATFNPWIGCTKISPACDHCYAEVSTPARTRHVLWGAGQERQRTAPSNWKTAERWNKQPFFQCAVCGRRGTEDELSKFRDDECRCYSYMQPARRRVFCASLADVFDNQAPAEWRIDLWDLIQATPNLDWLLLTKRIGNARDMLPVRWLDNPPKQVRIGATIANQEELDRDVPKLLALPFPNFLSMEPLLGPVDLAPSGGVRIEIGNPHPIGRIINQREAYPEGDPDGSIDWIIVGGESGPKARPMHPDWARNLRDQCAAAGVPFLFKQWGEWLPHDQLTVEAMATPPHGTADPRTMRCTHVDGRLFYQVGKEAAGRTLDGQLHDGYPGSAA